MKPPTDLLDPLQDGEKGLLQCSYFVWTYNSRSKFIFQKRVSI